MTKRFATILLCLLAALAVSSCQTIADKRKIDYKSTRTLPPLDLPPDLSVPEGGKAATEAAPGPATYSGLATEKGNSTKLSLGGELLPEFSDIRMARDGQMRWLVVKMPPEQLWPRVREFVLSNGLIIDK